MWCEGGLWFVALFWLWGGFFFVKCSVWEQLNCRSLYRMISASFVFKSNQPIDWQDCIHAKILFFIWKWCWRITFSHPWSLLPACSKAKICRGSCVQLKFLTSVFFPDVFLIRGWICHLSNLIWLVCLKIVKNIRYNKFWSSLKPLLKQLPLNLLELAAQRSVLEGKQWLSEGLTGGDLKISSSNLQWTWICFEQKFNCCS